MSAAITALPAGSRVVVPDVEFTSMLFPLLVQARLDVRTVPVNRLAEAVAEGADAVAFSAVQMSTGEVADLDTVVAAAARAGVWTLCDATQAAGWLPVDSYAFDAVLCHAYKWLMSPRGSAFLAVSDRLLEGVTPLHAGLGLEPGDSAIVSAEVPGGFERLESAGIAAAQRGGRLRTSWHVYNDAADVDRVLDVLA